MRDKIGVKIAELRKQKGLSQRELADRCGLGYSHIGKIEKGRYNVGIDTLTKITDVLGVEITFKAAD